MKFLTSVKLKSAAVLMLLVFLPSLSNAQVCFTNISSARAALTEVTYDKQNTDYLTKKYTLCNDERINLSAQNLSLNTEEAARKADAAVMSGVLGQYKTNYIDQNKKLNECVAATPSRMTWFGYGALAAVILGLVGAFAIK